MCQCSDQREIIVLHASAVCDRDNALIFLGPSGTGKSTMYHLLSPYLSPLSGDVVYLVPRGDADWDVVQGERSIQTGTKRMFANEVATLPRAPLRAIFRLYQAVEPKLERIDALLTCRYLTDAFFEITWQRDEPQEVKRWAFMNLAKISHLFPGYTFQFDLSLRTPQLLNQEVKLW